MAPPAAIEEGALVDDVDTLAHGGDGLRMGFGKGGNGSVRERELNHSLVAGSVGGQTASLMFEASSGPNLEFRILPHGTLDLAASRRHFLLGQRLALQECP